MATSIIDKALQQCFTDSAKIKKVWENVAPGSAFAAQTVEYDEFVADIFIAVTTRGNAVIAPADKAVRFYGAEGYPTQRLFTFTKESFTCTDAEMLNSGWKTNNTYVVPWLVYGVKIMPGGGTRLTRFLCRLLKRGGVQSGK